jgi:phosphate transport system substrate-binding protein
MKTTRLPQYRILLIFLAGFFLLSLESGQAQVARLVETQWTDYQPVPELRGNLVSVGSDSLANLTLFWAEDFKTLYPSVDITIESIGSGSAPPALALGSDHIGPMSRLMNEQEIEEFESKLGYKPTPFVVAIDALAVLVHPANPLPGLSMQQVANIFSDRGACGSGDAIRSWGQLGLAADWSAQTIELLGRNDISGTHQFFRQKALCNGEFRTGLTEFPGSASLVEALSQLPFGIAYSALGYAGDKVRILPLAQTSSQAAQQKFVEATAENAVNGTYPLARLLYIYVNHDPSQAWNPVQAEFIRMVLSRQGQEQVARAAFAPLPFAVANRELQKLAGPVAMTSIQP